jgi:hypothetical protein
MEDYTVNGKQTKTCDRVVFTDPWGGKHGATITKIEPKNGSHHVTLEADEAALDIPEELHAIKWFNDKSGKFEDVPHHKEGVPYSWDHVSE